MTEQLKKVREFMEEYADPLPDEIEGKMQFIADLGFNSLTLFEMVNDAEERFSVRFDNDEVMKVVTVDDFLDMLKKKNIEL